LKINFGINNDTNTNLISENLLNGKMKDARQDILEYETINS
jgi:hypothetical protein